jgi:hypothetical protein
MASATQTRRQGLTSDKGIKAPVAAATIANITLSGEQPIDGVSVLSSNAAGVPDRILVKNQTNAVENGIYDVSTGSWTRSLDSNGNEDLVTGTGFYVVGGSQAGQYWAISSTGSIVPGTSAITFTQSITSSSANALRADLVASTGSSIVGFKGSSTGESSTNLSVYLNLKVKGLKASFGAALDGVTDDTAAWTNALASGKILEIEEGTLLTDPFTLGNSNAGLMVYGQGFNPQYGSFGDTPSIIKLRGTTTGAFMTMSGAYNTAFSNLHIDAGGNAAVVQLWDGTVNNTKNCFKRVGFYGAANSTGKTFHFTGSVGGDSNYFELCDVNGVAGGSSIVPLNHIHNENSNAFKVFFIETSWRNAATMFRYGAGSCSHYGDQAFGATTAFFAIDNITQSFEVNDFYTEQTNAPFLVQSGTAGVTSPDPIILRDLQLNHSGNTMSLNCQQAISMDNVKTSANIDITPMATYGTQLVTSKETCFLGSAGFTGTGVSTNLLKFGGTASGTELPTATQLLNTTVTSLQSDTSKGSPWFNVTAQEYGDGKHHVTVITISNTNTLPAIAGGAALGVGVLLYTFPAGAQVINSSYINVAITQTQGHITSDTPTVGLGTVVASGAISVLSGTSTFQNISVGKAAADCNGTPTEQAAIPTAGHGLVLDVGSTKSLYFNAAANWSANGDTGAKLSGTVTVEWTTLS